MEILHFLWSGQIGGTERAVYQLVREQLKEPEIQVGIFFAQARGHYYKLMQELGCPVLSANLRNGRDVLKLPEIVRLIRDYEIHHFHGVEPLLFFASLLSGARLRVFTERGGYYPHPSEKRLRHKLAGIFLRKHFHGYSGNTMHAARVASERYRIPFEKFIVTYNGIDFSLLRPKRTRMEVRRELHVESGTTLIGTAAKLKDWKRIDKLLQACAALDRVNYYVLVVGEGPDRPRLESLARDLGISSQVIFAGMKEQVADYLAALDTFVLPSMGLESFGNAVIEAMSLGIPSVVFRDSPGLCEHIKHDETGFIVDDVEELAGTLKTLAENAGLRQKVGDQAKYYVCSKYSLEQMAQAYHGLYEQAAQNAGFISKLHLQRRRQ